MRAAESSTYGERHQAFLEDLSIGEAGLKSAQGHHRSQVEALNKAKASLTFELGSTRTRLGDAEANCAGLHHAQAQQMAGIGELEGQLASAMSFIENVQRSVSPLRSPSPLPPRLP